MSAHLFSLDRLSLPVTRESVGRAGGRSRNAVSALQAGSRPPISAVVSGYGHADSNGGSPTSAKRTPVGQDIRTRGIPAPVLATSVSVLLLLGASGWTHAVSPSEPPEQASVVAALTTGGECASVTGSQTEFRPAPAPLGAWMLSLSDLPLGRAALRLHKRYNRELLDGNFDGISAAFARANLTAMSPLVLVGSLRATYAARSEIPAWRGFAERVHRELVQRGEHADALLSGLLD